jgi:hypothetical protein
MEIAKKKEARGKLAHSEKRASIKTAQLTL